MKNFVGLTGVGESIPASTPVPESGLGRREVLVALSALMALGGISAGAETQKVQAVQSMPGELVMSKSHIYPFEKLPVKSSANGGASRAVVQGVTATGEFVEVHETTLPPGQMPHPPHKHRHSEFIMVREGLIEFDNDGNPTRVGPGGIMFNASMVMHGMKNVGETMAQYFVVEIGRPSSVTPV
jgi:uncharacterized cupin superfamily protein